MMAAACDAGTRAVMDKLRTGALHSEVPAMQVGAAIGVGQSMGGHIVVIAQAEHGTFEAIAILGSSFTQTRLALLPRRRYPARDAERDVLLRGAQVDTDILAAFHWPDEPAALVAADMDHTVEAPWRSRAIPRCAGRLMEPSIVAREAAAVRTPVFMAYGENDVTLEPLADAAMFRSTSDLTLTVVPRMAHMHNFAASRRRLWRRIDEFAFRAARESEGGNNNDE
jgi:pimeloyl-ACP methyl ester carboxylesterase